MVGRRFLGAAAALAAAGALLWQSQAVASGVRAGLEACTAVVIPSLFPFMILAGLCSSTPAGQTLSNGIWRLFRRPDPIGCGQAAYPLFGPGPAAEADGRIGGNSDRFHCLHRLFISGVAVCFL